jgi:hypothetical protein
MTMARAVQKATNQKKAPRVTATILPKVTKEKRISVLHQEQKLAVNTPTATQTTDT